MDESKPEVSDPLNLGLEDILKPVQEVDPSLATPEAPNAERPGASLDPEIKEPQGPNFLTLAQDGNWDQISKLTEAVLESSDDLESRLWWIRAQFETKQAPSSILAAPLEALCARSEELERKPVLKPILAKLLFDIGESVAAGGDRRTAIGVLQRSHQIDSSCGARLRAHVCEELEAMERTPPLRVQERDEYNRRLGELRALATELEKDTVKTAPVVEPEESAPMVAAREGVSTDRSMARFMVFAGFLFVVILGAVFYLSSGIDFGGGFSKMLTGVPAELAHSNVEHRTPPAELIQLEALPLQGPRGLDTLMYDLDQKPRGSQPPVPLIGSTGRTISPAVQPITPQVKKEVIDTSGPIEDTSFTEGRNRADEPRAVRRNSWGELEDSTGNLVLGPNNTDQIAPIGEGTAYKVLTQTKVLSSPNYRSSSIGLLLPGDKIIVEQRVGNFLRVRSLKGRAGYVLAQDVEVDR